MPHKKRKVIISEEDEKKKALKISLKEGATTSVSNSVGDSYITPFALALKGSSIHISILSAVAGLLAPIAQLFGSNSMEKKCRKNIVTANTLLQAIVWLPVALIGFLAWKGIIQAYLIYILIALYILFVILNGIQFPAWFSWMGDLVPEKHRGSFFSKRNNIIGAVGILAFLAGGNILKFFEARNMALLGFSLLFVVACLFKIKSYFLLKKQYHPEFKLKNVYYFSIISFIKKFDNYGKFAVYYALFNFSIMIASPFFAVYMLKNLGMENNYLLYTVVSLSSSLFYLVFAPLAGKFSDKYGNRPLFIIGAIAFSLNPLLWMFIKSPLLLIFIPQLITGLANAAMVISSTNFTYDAVSQQRRGLCITYTNILSGVGIFFGSLFGGFLLNYVHLSFITPFMLLFGVAAIARFLVAILLIYQIKEEKKVARLPPMHISLVHPFRTLYSQVGFIKYVVLGRQHRKI